MSAVSETAEPRIIKKRTVSVEADAVLMDGISIDLFPQ